MSSSLEKMHYDRLIKLKQKCKSKKLNEDIDLFITMLPNVFRNLNNYSLQSEALEYKIKHSNDQELIAKYKDNLKYVNIKLEEFKNLIQCRCIHDFNKLKCTLCNCDFYLDI